MLGGIIGGIGGAVTSGLNWWQQQQQNKQNQWNWMNQYQVGAADMEKAGLNKQLMAGSGAGAMQQNAPQLSENGAIAGVAQLSLLKAQKKNIEADTEKKKSENLNVIKATDKANSEIDAINANTALTKQNREKAIADTFRSYLIEKGSVGVGSTKSTMYADVRNEVRQIAQGQLTLEAAAKSYEEKLNKINRKR